MTLKAGITLDGKLRLLRLTANGLHLETSRYDAHHIRSINDAILVVLQTVIHDDPSLTARFQMGIIRFRIVLDSKLSTR
ncbi:dihydrofolate reductase family protein [Bacillus pumilus]|nr:dihydrofolate reductase family protein [Bacillus pumilus]